MISSLLSKMCSPATSIDDLPIEMICELFRHLFNLNDLITCSMVNKRWHSIYTDFRVHRLVTFGDFECSPREWCHPDRAINDDELSPQDVFERLVDKPLLAKI